MNVVVWSLPWKDTSVKIAVVSAVVSVLVSLGSAGMSYINSLSVLQKQVDFDLAGKFLADSGQLNVAGGEFIAAVNGGRSLQEARVKLNGLLDQRISSLEVLQTRLRLDENDRSYFETSLVSLIKATNEVKSPNQMPQWAEAFGRIIDEDQVLARRFYKKLGPNNLISQVL